MGKPIKVIFTGAVGKMGTEASATINQHDDEELELVARVDPVYRSNPPEHNANRYYVNLGDALCDHNADVLVDFTNAEAAMSNALLAAEHGLDVIIGTTGIFQDDAKKLEAAAKDHDVCVALIPNFAIGAVLMMKFAEIAAGYMGRAEIVELHHEDKQDAPSGTAKMIAEKIEKGRPPSYEALGCTLMQGARGATCGRDTKTHSIRLPGLAAHREVIFGGVGQTLMIRHDLLDRSSFMPGVVNAVKAIGERGGFVYGLDKLLRL